MECSELMRRCARFAPDPLSRQSPLRVAYPAPRRAEGERMTPKPRFFQIHLSTAVVLMLVAGVLVWANFDQQKPSEWYSNHWTDGHSVRQMCGWPIPIKFEIKDRSGAISNELSGWATANVIFNGVT